MIHANHLRYIFPSFITVIIELPFELGKKYLNYFGTGQAKRVLFIINKMFPIDIQ